VTGSVSSPGRFTWYELMTTNVAAAAAFYTEVVGWSARDASAPGTTYTLMSAGDNAVGGLMSLPEDARNAGATPRWVGYVGVDDVDAAVDRTARLGGIVHVPPTDLADISRIAIVADPQMAMFGLITPLDADREHAAAARALGRAGWHELLAADAKAALAFYAELLGWQNAGTGVDQGGTYQLFSAAGQTIGGIFTKPAMVPVPFWLYYFGVGDIDAAAERTTTAGGDILEGPLEVMGGAWVVRCVDPQGAMFALIGQRGKRVAGYFERTASRSPSGAPGRWSW
jgi:predicted enzyme related to lactoylglutathione lyase